MNDNETNHQGNHHRYGGEEEISLRELIEVLLHHKVMIALVTAAFVLMAGVYSFVIQQPVYESRALIVVNFPESVQTPYGTFTYPSRNVQEYTEMVKGPEAVKLTVKALDGEMTAQQVRNRIEVREANGNTFRIVAKNGDPQKAYQLARVHTENYLNYLRVTMRRIATDAFQEEKRLTEGRLEKELEEARANKTATQELLETISPTITLQNALIGEADQAILYSGITDADLSALSGETILTQVVNPAYERVQQELFELKLLENNLAGTLNRTRNDLIELAAEQSALREYLESLDDSLLTAGKMELTAAGVSVLNRPVINEVPVGPRRGLNLAIGLVLGLMLGVFAAFFRSYWEQSASR